MENEHLLKKSNDEDYYSYTWRVNNLILEGKFKNWAEVTPIVNRELYGDDETEYMGESAYRKKVAFAKQYYEAGVFGKGLNDDKYLKELEVQKQELYKEKVKLSDERTSLNRLLREQARKESTTDLIMKLMDKSIKHEFNYVEHPIVYSDNDLIIHLTDVHCGLKINNSLNTYDTEELKKRLKSFLNQIFEIKETHNSENAYLILGGDMISGVIHTNMRIENKENVIQQVMIMSDLVSDFIGELCNKFSHVTVANTMGNHGRVSPNKDDSVRGENFDLLIPHYAKGYLRNVQNVTFLDNTIEEDIAHFVVRGHGVYATHGDKDTPHKAVSRMCTFSRLLKENNPELIYLGHRHTNGLSTIDCIKVIQSGCLDGMDSYAMQGGFFGKPEQTVTVVTEEKALKCLYDLEF